MKEEKKTLDEKFLYYSIITLIMFISSVNYNLFIAPAKIVSSGAGGIATIANNVTGIDNALVVSIVMVIALVAALVFRKYQLFKSALYASILSPLFISLTSNVTDIIAVDYSNTLIMVLYAGIVSGITSGLLCKFNMSGGGIILLCQILCDKIKYSVSKCNFYANIIVVIVGGYYFGLEAILYAVIYIYICNYVLNKVLLGVSGKKLFYIVSSKSKQIQDYIIDAMNLDYTILSAEGALFKGKNVIMVNILTKDYFKLKEGIKAIDNKAFFVVTDSYESRGGKLSKNMI